MKTTKKLQLVASVLGLTAAVAGFSMVNASIQVKAEETAKFAMANGASVRAVANEAGIRWETTVNEAWFEANVPDDATDVEFGTIVAAAKEVTAIKNLTTKTEGAKRLVCKVLPDFTDETSFTYYSSILYNNMSEWTAEEQKAAYATELIARSYVKYSDGEGTTWLYADATDTARCMRAVALAAYEDTSDKALSTTQKEVVDDYFAATGNAIDFGGYYEMVNPDAISGNYTTAYLGAKKVGTVEAGTLALDGMELGDKGTLTFFDANGNYAKSTEFQYVTKAVTNASFVADLTTVTEESYIRDVYYALTEDIDLTGTTWTTSVIFKDSTLDGNGHTINGLSVANKKALFQGIQNAAIKNLAVKNVMINSAAGGGAAFAWEARNATFENVYVSLAPQLFDVKTATDFNAQTANCGKAAFVAHGEVYKEETTITLKNCVAYVPEHLVTDNSALVIGRSEGNTVVIENSLLIGGNRLIVGKDADQTTYSPDTITVDGVEITHGTRQGTDAVTAYKDITSKAEANRTFAEKAFLANSEYIELTAANFVEKWAALNTENAFGGTFQILVLTEDLDFAAKEGEKGYVTNGANFATGDSNARFFGVFDGQGHTISNLTRNYTGSYQAVFFNILYGSFKNVALVNFAITGTKNVGIIFCQTAKTALASANIENVYIGVTELSTSGSGVYAGAIVGDWKNHTLSMKDVVVYFHGENVNTSAYLFGKLGSQAKTLIFENCHFVNEWDTDTTANIYGSNGYTKSDLFAEGCGLTSYTTISQVNANNLTALAKGALGVAG